MSDKDEIYSDAQIESLIKNIFDGDTTADDLPESLYFAIADYLKKALYKGFGGTLEDFDGKPLELLTKLRENIYMFSSAKTFQQTLEMSDALTDSDNNIRTFSQFRKAAADIYAKYNGGNFLQDDDKAGYLRTEYNTAIAGGQMAERWTQIESQADDLPYLQMSVVEDANTSEICEPLDGITLPVTDPFWDEYYPPNHFNCRSSVLQLGEDAKLSTSKEVNQAKEHADEDMTAMFKNNVGKTGEVFNESHGYFIVPKEYQDLAERNFDLPIPETDEE